MSSPSDDQFIFQLITFRPSWKRFLSLFIFIVATVVSLMLMVNEEWLMAVTCGIFAITYLFDYAYSNVISWYLPHPNHGVYQIYKIDDLLVSVTSEAEAKLWVAMKNDIEGKQTPNEIPLPEYIGQVVQLNRTND